MSERAKYHGGITSAKGAKSQNGPGSLTCRDTGTVLCPRGDLNPHAQ